MNNKLISELTDNQLVALASKGNKEAFSVLLSRFSSKIFAKAKTFSNVHGAETDDYYQEGLIAFYSAIFSFDETKSTDFKSFSAMLVEQAMQRLYNSSKTQKNTPLDGYVDIDALSNIHSTLLTPEELFFLKEKRNKVLSSLSVFEYSVAKLYFLGFSRFEIADKLNCDVKKVDNAIQRIRKKIEDDNKDE